MMFSRVVEVIVLRRRSLGHSVSWVTTARRLSAFGDGGPPAGKKKSPREAIEVDCCPSPSEIVSVRR